MSAIVEPLISKYVQAGPYHWHAIDGSLPNRIKKYSLTLLARYSRILEALPPQSSDILEIGCGDGALSHLCALNGHRVTGLDLDDIAIQFARNKSHGQPYAHPIEFRTQNAQDLAQGGRRFDVVILADVIEHLSDPDEVMKTIQAILKPGGSLLLTTPFRKETGKWDVHHVYEYTTTDLGAFLKKYSRQVHVDTFHPLFLHQVYGKRSGRWALNLLGTLVNPFRWTWPGVRPVMLFASAKF